MSECLPGRLVVSLHSSVRDARAPEARTVLLKHEVLQRGLGEHRPKRLGRWVDGQVCEGSTEAVCVWKHDWANRGAGARLVPPHIEVNTSEGADLQSQTRSIEPSVGDNVATMHRGRLVCATVGAM